MTCLPIEEVLEKIKLSLHVNNRLVLQAPPGAGKTTMVPLSLLDESWLEDKQIIMLEPRRLATRSSAKRMASILNEKIGKRVGYQIKNERVISKESKIIVVTEGILTRMLQSDPSLENIALIIFDEFHERNLHADLALALSLQSQELLRDDLKIMVMSATLNTTAISHLLGNAPVIRSEGRSYPIEIEYLPSSRALEHKDISKHIVSIVVESLACNEGSILVFLPGKREIQTVLSLLHVRLKGKDIELYSLYGELSKEAQDKAIQPTSKCKVVLATNIAETSLTIEGIQVVVDSGLERISVFNPSSGMNTLTTLNISQESATQRAGRAGRLSAGKCYRLWHKHTTLAQHRIPEIKNSDITAMLLELFAWGIEDINELEWLDTPSQAALRHAYNLLEELGAVKERKITPHGKDMLSLGVHPRLAHMMLKAKALGCTKVASIIAALLSEKDIFINSARYSVDIASRVQAVIDNYRGENLDVHALRRVQDSARDFQKKLMLGGKEKEAMDKIGVLLAYAYPDRIAQCRKNSKTHYLLSAAKGAYLHVEDELYASEYLVLAHLDASNANAQIYLAARITLDDIEEYFSEWMVTFRSTTWNDTTQRVEAKEQKKLGALVLEERVLHDVNAEDISRALIAAIREKGLHSLKFSKECKVFIKRIAFLKYQAEQSLQVERVVGELLGLNEKFLLDNLERWLLPYLSDINSFKALQKLDTFAMIQALFSYKELQRIDTLAPTKIKVPSGSYIYINYEDSSTPILSVRLQEMFGMLDTPLLIENSIPLSVELLSPASRVMQVTKDLRSFWNTTYYDVKKELSGKYKKHYWPDNPLEAKATSKTKKYM